MKANDTNVDNIFIIVNLFLLAVVILMLLIQLIVWVIVISLNKKGKIAIKSYQTLLKQEQYDGTIKKVKLTLKFNNYNKQQNCLKLKTRDFEEKTLWNFYQNLISILLIKWKKTNKKTNIILITSILVFYLNVVTTIILTIIYYINFKQETITTSNNTLLSILSFINLTIFVLSWLTWTMTYEKLRKELIALVTKLENPILLKKIQRISNYKTLFPGSELLI